MHYFALCDQNNNAQVNDGIVEHQNKSQELRALKRSLQAEKDKRDQESFSYVQSYGRSVADLALLVMVTKSSCKKDQESSKAGLSLQDKMFAVKTSLSWFLILVEVARAYHGYKAHKRMIALMTYQDFVEEYPQLVLVMYHIAIMESLIELSVSGAFAQQAFARIQLIKMSLPPPYDRYANKCAKKLFKHSFDGLTGRFKWSELRSVDHPYKKFHKKVPQGFKEVAYYASSFPEVISDEYETPQAALVSNDYNDTLIHMIYAGMKQDTEKLYELSQKYRDGFIKKVYRYYVA